MRDAGLARRELSRTSGKRVMNLDIGGGTANMAVFERGEPIANGCLDIGGRLLRFEDDDCTVHSFSPAMRRIARDAGVPLAEGTRLTGEETDRLAQRMAEVLEEAAGLRPRTPLHDDLCVEACLPDIGPSDIYTFSGGVSECIYGTDEDTGRFHDLGAALGRAVASSRFFVSGRVMRPAERSYATVIGAGAYSVAVSGSTICYQGMSFPLPSLPTARCPLPGRRICRGWRRRCGNNTASLTASAPSAWTECRHPPMRWWSRPLRPLRGRWHRIGPRS